MQEIIDFVKRFQKEDNFPFSCPFCNKQTLSLNKDSWYDHDTSKFHEMDEYIDPSDCVSYIYTAVYDCKNSSCNQKVISSGVGHVDEDESEEDGRYVQSFYSVYKPKMFLPPLNFFPIPPKTPVKIQSLLELSFSIVLQSPSSAVNSLRSCVEELLDIHSLPRGKKLHHRIEQDVPKNPVLAPFEEYLMAIKWLGNTGSHGDEIDLVDIIDVYEIMEFILKGLYAANKSILEKARLINELKRPLSRQERKKIS